VIEVEHGDATAAAAAAAATVVEATQSDGVGIDRRNGFAIPNSFGSF